MHYKAAFNLAIRARLTYLNESTRALATLLCAGLKLATRNEPVSWVCCQLTVNLESCSFSNLHSFLFISNYQAFHYWITHCAARLINHNTEVIMLIDWFICATNNPWLSPPCYSIQLDSPLIECSIHKFCHSYVSATHIVTAAL